MPFPNTILLPIQFSGGLNSKIDEFTLDQPYLQELQNGEYNEIGRIDKRAGFYTISNNIQGGGNINKGATLTTYNNELLLMDGETLYSWQEEQEVWISRGTLFSTVNNQVRVLNTKSYTQSNPDTTSCNNISLYIWEDTRIVNGIGQGLRYSVINNKTNTSIVSDQAFYVFGTRPKVITDGYSTFYAFYNVSFDTILYNIIPVAAPYTVSSQYNTVCLDGYSSSSPNPSIAYDVVMFQGQPLVCYAGEVGVTLSLPLLNIEIPFTSTKATCIGMCIDSQDRIWVSFSDNINSYAACLEYNGTTFITILAPIVIDALVAQPAVNIGIIEDTTSPGCANICCEIAKAGNNNFVNNYLVSIEGSSGTSILIGEIRSVGLASKPFEYNGNLFINTVYSSALQSTYFTTCISKGTGFSEVLAAEGTSLATNFSIVSKHSPQNGGGYRTNNILSQADPIGGVNADTFLFAGQRKGAFTSWANSQTANLGCAGYSITFTDPNSFNNVSSNNNLHIVGGVKKIYDGVSCVEDNFHLFPETADGYGCDILNSIFMAPSPSYPDGYLALTSAQLGNLNYNPLTQPNTYQWLVVYEWADNFQQVQRSGTSIPITALTQAVGQGAKLTGPMLRLTDKINPRAPVIISIYRTQNSLPIFYKITDDNNPILNDETLDSWTYVDRLSDTQIAANENIYTNSQLSNIGPPACSLISLYQLRLIINSTEDPGVLWYSQNKFEQDQYNTLALDWNTSFVEGVDSRAGNAITAIGLIDNWLAIFKEASIFTLTGDGPNALNTADGFNDAQLLVSDTGCVNQNSLCFITQTPTSVGGLLFKSPKGIYLLGRDQSLLYVGAPVEKYNNLTITSANLLTQKNEVIFTTLEGTMLVYNYYFNAWSTWQNLPAVSATIWEDQICILRSDGRVMIQDITETLFSDMYSDNIVKPVPLVITTPWIKFQQMQGYMSVFNCMLLGTLQGAHTLSCSVSYDYNPSIVSNGLISSTVATNRWGSLPIWGSQGIWGDDQFSNYQFQINMNRPRCQSIQLTFTDVNNPAYTKAFSLNGLVLEIMPHQGSFRLPTSNKVGLK